MTVSTKGLITKNLVYKFDIFRITQYTEQDLQKINVHRHVTERCDSFVRTPASYFGGPGFKSWRGYRRYRMRVFVVFSFLPENAS